MFASALAELTDIEEALDLALKVDFHALSADERDDAVAQAARLKSKLTALRSAAVQAYDANLDFGREGHRSPNRSTVPGSRSTGCGARRSNGGRMRSPRWPTGR